MMRIKKFQVKVNQKEVSKATWNVQYGKIWNDATGKLASKNY